MKIGILGYGYTANSFAHTLIQNGHRVWGTSRNADAIPYAVPSEVEIISFEKSVVEDYFSDTTHLLICTPPNEIQGCPALHYFRDLIVSKKKQLRWIGYLSSTGVYGDHQGAWVDEKSPCRPNTERTQIRLSAEQSWLSLYEQAQLPIIIFRLSGIYGPKRNALARLTAGKNTSIKKEAHYISRIHVDDICTALYNSLRSPMPGHIFNLADDHPCPSYEVDLYAAHCLAIEPPKLLPFDSASLSPMAQSFYQSNKRVNNSKLKQYLVKQLKYPSYEDGLQGMLNGEKYL